jgi:signal transduction histidine kinase
MHAPVCRLPILGMDGIGYNVSVRERMYIIRLLRVASVLWLTYLGLSAAIDYTLKSPGRVQDYFYLTSAAIALFIMAISFWHWIQDRLKGAFLPLVIFLICALPAATNQIAIHYLFPNLQGPPEALLNRVTPFLLIALILVAWQYHWRYILVFCVLVAALNTGILLVFRDGQADLSNGLFAILTQIMSFLMVGFFIIVLVSWLQRQRRSLEDANAKLASYAQTLEDLTVSRERTRLAQELHDTLSHTLSGLSVQLETMKAYWQVDPAVAREVLEKSSAATRAGLDETRRALFALRARPLEELGLAGAIRQAAAETAQRGHMMLEIDIAEDIPVLSAAAEQCVFRVAQEAVTNAARHSKANTMKVGLREHEKGILLIVQDNGIGFDTEQDGHGHLGVTGMRERARLSGGELVITSEAGHGTMVRLTVRQEKT